MAYALIASDKKAAPDPSGVTTDGVNTTGADFIAISVGWYYLSGVDVPTISDSKSNTYTGLTRQSNVTTGIANRLWYVQAPTVGSGHTITVSGGGTNLYPSVAMYAFSGSVASPFDQQNGASGNGISTLQPGSITPTEDNELIIMGLGHETNGGGAVNNAYATAFQAVAYVGGTAEGCALGYTIQTTASTVNPTWDVTNNTGMAVTIASFKSPAVGHPTMRRWGGTPYMGGQGIGQKGSAGGSGRAWGRRRSGIIVPSRYREAA